MFKFLLRLLIGTGPIEQTKPGSPSIEMITARPLIFEVQDVNGDWRHLRITHNTADPYLERLGTNFARQNHGRRVRARYNDGTLYGIWN